jgi:DNA-binding response OmpR family regulator
VIDLSQQSTATSIKVLILEDEPTTGAMLKSILGKHGFCVDWIEVGNDLISRAKSFKPNVVVVDNVPGQSSKESCRLLRANAHVRQVPIVVYSSTIDENEIMDTLAQGADDFIVKSFSPKYLVARIEYFVRSIVRRRAWTGPSRLEIKDLVIDTLQDRVLLGGKLLRLSPSELEILSILAAHFGRCISRAQLANVLASHQKSASPRVMDVLILRLRKKILDSVLSIESVRFVGYRLVEKSRL